MAHWKKFMDKDLLGAHDLDGRDVTVTIVSVSGGEVTGSGNKKNKKPIATLQGTSKKLVLNPTNCKTIEQLYGTPDVDKWKGVRVTLFPTTTQFGGQTVDCIRIRPFLPAPPKGGKRSEPAPVEAEPPPQDLDADITTGDEAADAAG